MINIFFVGEPILNLINNVHKENMFLAQEIYVIYNFVVM